MSTIPLHRLVSHATRRRELDVIESLPLKQRRDKMARLEQVRRVNRLEWRILPYATLIVMVVVMPYLAIKLSDFLLSFSGDALRNSVWFPLLIAVVTTILLAVCCASFILVPYGNSLRELDYRTECLDENSPTSRLNAALSAAHRQMIQDKNPHSPEHS